MCKTSVVWSAALGRNLKGLRGLCRVSWVPLAGGNEELLKDFEEARAPFRVYILKRQLGLLSEGMVKSHRGSRETS
jgi:hypothetical protein